MGSSSQARDQATWTTRAKSDDTPAFETRSRLTNVGSKPGGLVHVELASANPVATRRFLEETFSWRFEVVPGLEYSPFGTPSGPGGAVMPQTEERPKGVLNYILSEDIERDIGKVRSAGGRITGPREEIPGVGCWALFEEPGGCLLALFQPMTEERGPVARYRT